MTFLIVSNFVDRLPVNRILEILKREGIVLSAYTISDWFEAIALLLYPPYQAIAKKVVESGYIQVDESIFPVLDNEKSKAVKTYL